VVPVPAGMLVMVRDANAAVAVKIIHVHLVSSAYRRIDDYVKSAGSMCSVVTLRIVHHLDTGI
jgi:hypothetical protein